MCEMKRKQIYFCVKKRVIINQTLITNEVGNMKNEWKLEQFSALDIDNNIKEEVFVVPRYQRGVVWKDQQRADLVDTIKKGLPFGTLLLYKDKNTNVYQIIDGLQRSNAIIEFVQNPTQFFDEEDIDVSLIRKIVEMAGMQGNIHAQEEEIKVLLKEWVKDEHKTLGEVEGMQFPKFGQKVSKKFPVCRGMEFDIGDLIEPMMKNYIEICKKISTTKIPAIVLEGDPDLLPVLFERINSKGTQLSKYQIYAATWSGKKYLLKDQFIDLVKANRDRYDFMLDGNGTLDDYNATSFMHKKELDAFELAFGFGKYLCDKWPHLFGKNKEDKQVESIGFTLLTCCLGMKNKDAKILNIKLEERVGDEKINDFLAKIVEVVHYIDKYIGKFSKFKSNTRANAGARPLHTEFQIVSIIASVFLMKYAQIDKDDNDNIINVSFVFEQTNIMWKQQYKKLFEKNAAKIYIMEILQHRWSGTGDKKMDMVLIDPAYYTRTVLWDEFAGVLDIWFDSINKERSEFKRIATAKEPELVILAAIYLVTFNAQQQIDGSNYDIEHLATQNLMKKHLDRFDGNLRLPISSIGNLCLLPEYANRSKKDKTIYEDTEYLKKSKLTIEEVEEKYTFTKKNDLDWIYDNSSSQAEFENQYKWFIRNRFEEMKKKLEENYIYV